MGQGQVCAVTSEITHRRLLKY